MSPDPFDRLAVAGHNLSAWVVIPPTEPAADATYEVRRQALGAQFLAGLFPKVLPGWRGRIDGGGAADTSPLGPADDRQVAWILKAQSRSHNKPGQDDQGGTDSVFIADRQLFRAPEELLPPDHAPVSFSKVRLADGRRSAAVLFVEANLAVPGDAIAGTPGFLLLHLSSSRTFGDEASILAVRDLIRSWHRAVGPNLVVVTSSKFFVNIGMPLNDESSWESMAERLVESWPGPEGPEDPAAPARDQLLACLARCPEVIVRHKAFAAVRFRTAPGPAARPRLYYFVDADHTLGAHPGYLIGYNLLLSMSLARELVDPDGDDPIEAAIRRGLYRCTQFALRGYSFPDRCACNPAWAESLFADPAGDAARASGAIWDVEIPARARRSRAAGLPWSVLEQLVATPAPGREYERAAEMAAAIVRKGDRQAQAEHRFPVVRFRELKVVDRRTFEDYWQILEVVRTYLRHVRSRPGKDEKKPGPLSLAVFGRPGGGKSFGVKQITRMMGGAELDEPREVNVAQFTSVGDLERVFKEVSERSLSSKVPLVFFDEFDATWEDRAFGWLRYFLAPMQDGFFGTGPGRIPFGPAIFVFVGGVNHTFEMFNGRMLNRDFIAAKGPDFVSRLARHLDVLGIDAQPPDVTYLLRRAEQLRYHLEKVHPRLRQAGGSLLIAEDVLRAFLHVPRFKHGARSLEAIVRTSRLDFDNPSFHWGSLPPPEQLEMHVSVHAFERARDRRPGDPPLHLDL